jgi:hypothetical protein
MKSKELSLQGVEFLKPPWRGRDPQTSLYPPDGLISLSGMQKRNIRPKLGLMRNILDTLAKSRRVDKTTLIKHPCY